MARVMLTSEGLRADPQLMPVQQHLRRERRPKVGVPGLYQLNRILPDALLVAPVRRPAPCLADQPTAAPLASSRASKRKPGAR